MTELPSPVAIVGAGLVGCGWAAVFASAGAEVAVYDERAETRQSAVSRIERCLGDMRDAGLADDIAAASGRITVVGSLEEALAGALYVQESVFEEVDIKAALAGRMGPLLEPDAIVASSSSGIPASAFTEQAPGRERFLVVHPVNPPHLIPVVEIVPAPWTHAEVAARTRAIMLALGKTPVSLTREIEGFILNRLQGALLNEAFALYDDGLASAADIDATISEGLGLRWAFMGPFETIDLNAPKGVADYATRFSPLYHNLARSRQTVREWRPDLVDRLSRERRNALPLAALEERARWRDGMLKRLVAHLRGLKPD